MSITFSANHVSLLSDEYDTLIIQDSIIAANADSHTINGLIQSVIVMDKGKNTWLFTVPSWEYAILANGQHVHFEGEQHSTSAWSIDSQISAGPRYHTEEGATFVCLRVSSNSGGGQALLTRQISSKSQLSFAKLMGGV